MRELNLNGYIDDESWFGDEITPDGLHEQLYGKENNAMDDVHIRLNSYGGSCRHAAENSGKTDFPTDKRCCFIDCKVKQPQKYTCCKYDREPFPLLKSVFMIKAETGQPAGASQK